MGVTDETGLRKALSRVEKTCKAIRLLLIAVAVVFAIGWLVALIVSAMALTSGGAAANIFVYAFVYGCLTLGIILLLIKIFMRVVRREELFSTSQANALRAIAVLALGMFLVDALFSVGFSYDAEAAVSYMVDINGGTSEPTVNLNVGMLVFSGIMYSLSAIFRYAALLQQLSDDTV